VKLSNLISHDDLFSGSLVVTEEQNTKLKTRPTID
jgi:hypothetical protein